MSKDTSSSSSEEDEQDSPASSATQRQPKVKRPSKYQCPAEYVTFSHKPCSSLLADSLKKGNQELWLLKAPASFNPECFSGIQVPLSGLQTLRVPTAEGGADGARSQQIYSILASPQGTPQLRLLTSHSQSLEDMECAPAFSGLLNVCESYGDIGANQTPQAIPAAPAPSIPAGLKLRFKPFGSKTPVLTCVAESEADCTNAPSSATLLPRVVKRFPDEEDEEEGRKKKKKKKEKRIKVEAEEVVEVKEEPVMQTIEFDPFQDADVSVEKRKKKKKKKDKERGEVGEEVPKEEEAAPLLEEVEVKSEPLDIAYGDVESLETPGKKKKKKKKSKTDED